MIERRLLRQIEKVAGRWRHRRLLTAWIVTWLAIIVIAWLIVAANRMVGWYLPGVTWALAAAAAVGALAAIGLAWRSGRDPRRLARHIESCYPELNTALLAAIDQQPELPGERYGYLQATVIEQALRHAYRVSWLKTVPPWKLLTGHLLNLVMLVGMIACLVALPSWLVPAPPTTVTSAAAATLTLHGDFDVKVEPGSTEVERGTGLLVMARFSRTMPPEATLVVTRDDGVREQFAMSKSLEDPVFGARIPEITAELSYRVEFAGRQTERFDVNVFEYPRLERADARLRFPDYTSLKDRVVEDVRRLSAVEKTHVKLTFRLNKSVAEAVLVDGDGQRTELQKVEEDPRTHTAEFVLQQSLRLRLKLVDPEGRSNKQPPEFVIKVLPNKPPDLKLVQPSRDLEVSPLEEVEMKASVWDDFGVARVGLNYMLDDTNEEVVLAQAAGGKERTSAEYTLALENLEAEPDQLVSYYFWAEDSGPDGAPRRVASDIYFAEVRHFEEIFREGQAPPGGDQQQQQGGGGGGGPSQQLAELQKQIISGTWKVIRRDRADPGSKQFHEDVGVLVDSQGSALEQAEELTEAARGSAQSMQHVLDLRRHMLDAIQGLAEAAENEEIEPLTKALAAEQAAYQSLLRLRDIEQQVVRGNRRGGGGGGGRNRSQRQLDQLQLRDNDSRYETESQARSQQEQQDTETRQVLNRLRELARRQSDLNDRLQELQSALEAAQEEEEREEILRQLQRLREEQQRILRDVDEVRDRMEQPDNQERMAGQQQQLDQTRENVRQASEALEEGRLGQAVAAGTRAEREFQELRDEFRRQSSRRFQDEMREMRQRAQQLDTEQQEISEQIRALNVPSDESRSLRDTGGRDELIEQLADQQSGVEQLLDEMREMVQEAEASEPLLAGELYDTARNAMHDRLPDVLEATRRSAQRGFLDDAQQLEQRARGGVRQLRDGVARAAEHVLGDETEALRKAREELQSLRRDLEQEMDRLAGPQESPSGNRPGDQPDENESPPPASRQDDQQAPGQQASSDRESEREGAPGGARPADRSERGSETGSSLRQPSPGQSQGEPSDGARSAESQQPTGRARRAGELRTLSGRNDPRGLGGGGGGRADDRLRQAAPLTGDNFREWSDRLRNVEEMISDPDLRAEAARIRDRARGVRQDVKRHSEPPNWDLVKLRIVTPLAELQQRVVEELLRRSQPDAMVPIDRDPVPPRFSQQVEKYYEQLGSGQLGSER